MRMSDCQASQPNNNYWHLAGLSHCWTLTHHTHNFWLKGAIIQIREALKKLRDVQQEREGISLNYFKVFLGRAVARAPISGFFRHPVCLSLLASGEVLRELIGFKAV